MEQLESQKGRQKFASDGFQYVFDKESGDGSRKFWRCERKGCRQRTYDRCPARVHTDVVSGQIVARLRDHNHDSDPASVEVLVVKSAIKRRADETVELQIINHEVQNLELAVMGQMPTNNALRKLVQRKRHLVNAAPPAPATLEELVVPQAFRIYEAVPGAEENFLLADSGAEALDANRILIFGWERNMEWVDQVTTLRQAPPLFAQIYIVLAERHGYVFPLLYILLPDKQRRTYQRQFALIHERWPQLQPQSISIDFEIAVFAPLREVFPNAHMFGCLFHLAKNMKKKLAEEGLIQRYRSEPDFALQARMVVAVAFVPLHAIDEAIEMLADQLPAELQPVVNWFEDNYIGRVGRNGGRRRAAVFHCNNHAEAAHRRLQTELQMDHPSLWKLIDGLRKVQKSRDLDYERMVRGDPLPAKRAKYQQADARILRLVQGFNDRVLLEFLRGISHSFVMDQ